MTMRPMGGLIPARAGNTSKRGTRRRPWGAHPRSRGEHHICRRARYSHRGSSPLARGTQILRYRLGHLPGLIPARAGNTFASSSISFSLRAHPRSRGEHGEPGAGLPEHKGSSPLARGTRNHLSNGLEIFGLIPARAGNTVVTAPVTVVAWAHPRSRGEHWTRELKKLRREGSSPLARGTLPADAGCLQALGLIPARAGNTSIFRLSVRGGWAHPRSRGEHPPGHCRHEPVRGSSPLARGTRLEVAA